MGSALLKKYVLCEGKTVASVVCNAQVGKNLKTDTAFSMLLITGCQFLMLFVSEFFPR